LMFQIFETVCPSFSISILISSGLIEYCIFVSTTL
jgi:hypothetical protein